MKKPESLSHQNKKPCRRRNIRVSKRRLKMVQKKFREIKDWNEWLRLWEENDVEEIAVGLLHAGPEVYQFSSCDTPERGLENELERIRFYLEVAWMDEHPRSTSERVVGNKAYQALIHLLLWKLGERMKERWASDLQPEREATVWSEIINFFANSKRSFSLDREPYRSKARVFISGLHSSLKDRSREPFLFAPETKKILSQKSEELAMALVNLKAFDYILQEEIFEAIPALKEKVFTEISQLQQLYPGKDREWWMTALGMPTSQAFIKALKQKETGGLARTLMELLVKRDWIDISMLAKT